MSEFKTEDTKLNIEQTPVGGYDMSNIKRIRAGAGSEQFQVNSDGLFLGADNFADAPFKVTYAGVLSATGATVRGTINADDITAGTLSGRTVKATGGTGNDVWLDSSTGQVQFRNAGTAYGYIVCDTSLNMLFVAKDTHYFFDQSSNYLGKIFRISASDYGMELPGGAQIQFTSGSNLKDTGAELQLDRQFRVNGTIYPRTDGDFNCGASDKEWNECWADAFNGASSEKLKENINTITNSLDKIKQLKPVSFSWKKDGKNSLGLILEESLDIIPELIANDKYGKPAGINYGKLPILLLDCVKELVERLEKLEKEFKNDKSESQ